MCLRRFDLVLFRNTPQKGLLGVQKHPFLSASHHKKMFFHALFGLTLRSVYYFGNQVFYRFESLSFCQNTHKKIREKRLSLLCAVNTLFAWWFRHSRYRENRFFSKTAGKSYELCICISANAQYKKILSLCVTPLVPTAGCTYFFLEKELYGSCFD